MEALTAPSGSSALAATARHCPVFGASVPGCAAWSSGSSSPGSADGRLGPDRAVSGDGRRGLRDASAAVDRRRSAIGLDLLLDHLLGPLRVQPLTNSSGGAARPGSPNLDSRAQLVGFDVLGGEPVWSAAPQEIGHDPSPGSRVIPRASRVQPEHRSEVTERVVGPMLFSEIEPPSHQW